MIKEREAIVESLERLKAERYALLSSPYALELEIQQKEAAIRTLTQKMRSLDALIDEVEDERFCPVEAYQEHLSALNESKQREQEALAAQKLLAPLGHHLERIAYVLQRMKEKGFLSYIFGPRPHATIALHLQELKEGLVKTLPKSSGEVHTFLLELQTLSAQKPELWVAKAMSQIETFDRSLSRQREIREEKETKLLRWIEQYKK